MKLGTFVLWALVGGVCCLPAHADDANPQTAQELYDSFDPKAEELDVQVIREWDEEGVHIKFVTYHVGTFEGQKGRIYW